MVANRLLSVKSGNPITIHDEDIGITWPEAVVSCI
jgi:proline utilization trans-activator